MRKSDFIEDVKENAYTCYACGADLWDDHRNKPKRGAVYGFKERASGKMLYACRCCNILVAREERRQYE